MSFEEFAPRHGRVLFIRYEIRIQSNLMGTETSCSIWWRAYLYWLRYLHHPMVVIPIEYMASRYIEKTEGMGKARLEGKYLMPQDAKTCIKGN